MDREHFDLTFLKRTEIFNQVGNLEHHQNAEVCQNFANNQTSRQLNAYKNNENESHKKNVMTIYYTLVRNTQ